MIIDKNFSPLMEQMFSGRSFLKEEVEALVRSMIDGTLSNIRIAAVLTGFRYLPLSEDIVISIVKVLQKDSATYNHPHFSNLVDCGQTGERVYSSSTVDILTPAAIVAAARGAKVAKFSVKNSLSSVSSSDVLQVLDIMSANSFKDAYEELKKLNLTLLDSNIFYHDLKRVFFVQKTLGFRTIFDVVAPLSNPTFLTGQFIGVYQKDLLPLLIHCLKKLGRKRAIVAYGEDGCHEISVCSATYIGKLEKNKISYEILKPSDFGFECFSLKDLKGKDLDYHAKVLVDVLRNNASPAIMASVVINAAATLWCAEKCETLQEGVEMAKQAIVSGKAYKVFEEWKKAR